MPELIGSSSIIVPASGSTRRSIVLKPEYSDAQLSLADAPDGVWLDERMLYVSSRVVCSAAMKVCAKHGEEESVLCVDIVKDDSLHDVPPADLEKPGWKLFYHDEFNGPELDPEHWCPYYLRGWTTDEKAKADYSFREGCLVIACSEGREPWSRQDGKHRVSSLQTFERKHLHRFGQVSGARDLMDFDGFTTQYGYFEIRARFPDTGDGSHFAWWMIGVQDDQNGFAHVDGQLYPIGEYSNQTAEYDIIEQSLDRASEEFDINCWRPVIHPNGSRDIQYLWVPPAQICKNAASEFHRYGFEWDENGTKFYLDGELVQQTDRTPPYRMMTLLSVYGGCKDGTVGMGPDRGIYPKEVLIDYFRVYKKDEAPKATSVRINPDKPVRCLYIPQSKVAEYQMQAQVFDQFDHELTGEKVRWHLSKDISGTVPLSEKEQKEKKVFIESDSGKLYVYSNAEEATELFVTAVHQSGRLATHHIRLSRNTPKPMCLRFENAKVALKAGNSMHIKANLFDQYGNVLNEMVRYQISQDIAGNKMADAQDITLKTDGTVFASANAVQGNKYVITAHAADLICACIVKIEC